MSESRGEIPKKIDRYEIIEAVGYGAMGAVYRAFDPLIKRPVAVKTLRLDVPPQSPDYKAFLDRFATEARTAGRLSHPNIITLYDVGHTEDQVPWLAMEYVDGQTVAELLEGDRLRAEVVVGLVSQIAAAIDYAHTEGVIHRDIKPSNVIVFGGEKVKVTDFGIAKLMDADVTQSGLMMGTPSYMSPEQAMGEDLDGRTDIFSLGVVAFEMLSGRQPFPGNNVTSILYKLVHSDPVHPDDLEVLGLLPDKWHQVFSRVLSKDPIERFATAADFVEQLEHCLGSWFGSLEGETVIIKDPAALAAAAAGAESASDETVIVKPGDGSVSGDADETVMAPPPRTPDPPVADSLHGATKTLERDALLDAVTNETITNVPSASPPITPGGEDTVFVPPPDNETEETLYADADETIVDPADETVLDPNVVAAAAATRPSRGQSGPPGKSGQPIKLGALGKLGVGAGLLAVVVLLIAFLMPRPDDAPVDTDPTPPPPPPRVVLDSGSLIVTSEPVGASVSVDGQPAGVTPIELELPLVEHELVVELGGYHAEELTASLTADDPIQTVELAMRREPPQPAYLRIRSEPAGARVSIDGDDVGATPTDRLRVNSGNRTVRVVQDGFLPWEDAVRARSGRTVDVDAVLMERRVTEAPPDTAEDPVAPQPPRVEIGSLVRRGEAGVINPVCIQCPSVRYPESARRARLEGVVELGFIIDENGVPSDVVVQESAGDIFDSAVTAAVREWRWQPATKYDVPVKIQWVQRFRFRQGR